MYILFSKWHTGNSFAKADLRLLLKPFWLLLVFPIVSKQIEKSLWKRRIQLTLLTWLNVSDYTIVPLKNSCINYVNHKIFTEKGVKFQSYSYLFYTENISEHPHTTKSGRDHGLLYQFHNARRHDHIFDHILGNQFYFLMIMMITV